MLFRKHPHLARFWPVLLTCFLACSICIGAETPDTLRARRILAEAGVQGGLLVHLGSGDGRLTTALRAGNQYVVHGLDTDGANVEKARRQIHSLGLYGPVSVDTFDGRSLPYADDLVNLLVAEELGNVPIGEVMRVLVPNGVAMIGGKKAVKPWPEDIDEWTHFLYDATGNAVSHDTRVGPPRQVKWKAGPKFARHHDLLASTSAMVSAGGRIFYIADEGPTTLMNYPPKWRLIARDAFNGTSLWKRQIRTWEPDRPFRTGPPQIARRLVAVGNRVYATLGIDAPVSELDAATGRTLRTFEGTERADEIILRDDVLLLVVGAEDPAAPDTARRRGALVPGARRSLIAVDLNTGAVLWKKTDNETVGMCATTLAAGSKHVLFQRGTQVCCLDLRTGNQLWSSEIASPRPTEASAVGKASKQQSLRRRNNSASFFAQTLVIYEPASVVLATYGLTLNALSLDDGRPLWQCPCPADFHSPSDVFVADGLVWSGLFATEGRNPKTGQVERKLNIEGLLTPGHHPRCYRNKATDRFLIAGKRGMEFFDLREGRHLRNDWVRGQCQYGIMPSGGLLYMPPNPCCCYPNALLHGFYALAAEDAAAAGNLPASTRPRLEKGRSYGGVGNWQLETDQSNDWPSLRGGELRSGSSPTALPMNLEPLWTASIGGRLSSPVIAGNRLLVSAIDECRVVALDAENGRKLWSFIAGSRVDSPPTVAGELVVFGSADGWIYCLCARDGRLVWRYRAAPREKHIMVDNRLESAWPVHGSVLVKDGVAYAAAGRSVFLDGGIYLCGLDLQTGQPRYETHLAVDPSDARSKAFIMEGVRPDVLVTDGKYLYLQHVQFDAALKPTGGRGRHIVATSGLTDDSWFYRTFWRLGLGDYGNDFPPSYVKHAFTVPMGQLLAFDSRHVCGLKTHMSKSISPGTAVGSSPGCLLYGASNTPFAPDAETPPSDFPHGKTTATSKPPKGTQSPSHLWSVNLPYQARAMLLTRRVSASSEQESLLFVSGWPPQKDSKEMDAAMGGHQGGLLEVYDPATGRRLAKCSISSAPIFDGMAAADGRLYLSSRNGSLVCLGASK